MKIASANVVVRARMSGEKTMRSFEIRRQPIRIALREGREAKESNVRKGRVGAGKDRQGSQDRETKEAADPLGFKNSE